MRILKSGNGRLEWNTNWSRFTSPAMTLIFIRADAGWHIHPESPAQAEAKESNLTNSREILVKMAVQKWKEKQNNGRTN